MIVKRFLNTGSHELRCNNEGKCQCKKGVTGDKCDRCIATFYDFGQNGCKSCECNVAGSLYNTPSCDPDTGNCLCKKNVEGTNCEVYEQTNVLNKTNKNLNYLLMF